MSRQLKRFNLRKANELSRLHGLEVAAVRRAANRRIFLLRKGDGTTALDIITAILAAIEELPLAEQGAAEAKLEALVNEAAEGDELLAFLLELVGPEDETSTAANAATEDAMGYSDDVSKGADAGLADVGRDYFGPALLEKAAGQGRGSLKQVCLMKGADLAEREIRAQAPALTSEVARGMFWRTPRGKALLNLSDEPGISHLDFDEGLDEMEARFPAQLAGILKELGANSAALLGAVTKATGSFAGAQQDFESGGSFASRPAGSRASGSTAEAEVTKRATALMAQNPKLTMQGARGAVLRSDKKLFDAVTRAGR